jgi:hypothetical protein
METQLAPTDTESPEADDAAPASIENVYLLVRLGEFEAALEMSAELGAA